MSVLFVVSDFASHRNKYSNIQGSNMRREFAKSFTHNGKRCISRIMAEKAKHVKKIKYTSSDMFVTSVCYMALFPEIFIFRYDKKNVEQ